MPNETEMCFENHLRLIVRALWRWLVSRFYVSLVAGALWWTGLWLLHVPLALLWAILAGLGVWEDLTRSPQTGSCVKSLKVFNTEGTERDK